MEDEIYQMEIGAFERVGAGRPLEILRTTFGGSFQNAKVAELYKRLTRFTKTPEEKFKELFSILVEKYSNLNISDSQLITLNNLFDRIDNLKYKNPAAFLFGYYILDKDKKIDKKKLEKIDKILVDQFVDLGVEREDVIRYARFISNKI